MKTKTKTKTQLAQEFVEVREQMNELKRKEKVLREFFIEDMGDKSSKKYGPIRFTLHENERERIDLDKLYLNYPEIYQDYLATYVYMTLRVSK